MASTSITAVTKQIGDLITSTVSPVLAALTATAQENHLAATDLAAATARLEAKVDAIASRLAALESGAPKRAINVGTVDAAGVAAPAARAKKDPTAPRAYPTNSMLLFVRDFSEDAAVRAPYAAKLTSGKPGALPFDIAMAAAGIEAKADLGPKEWAKIARTLWTTVPAATKEEWKAKHVAGAKAAPPAELALDEGDVFAPVTLEA